MTETKINISIDGAVMVVDVERKVVSGYEVANRTTQIGDKSAKPYTVPVDGRLVITDINAVTYDKDQRAAFPLDVEKAIGESTKDRPLDLDMPDGTKVPPVRDGKSDTLDRNQVLSSPQHEPPKPGAPPKADEPNRLDPTKPAAPSAEPPHKQGDPVKVGDTVKLDAPAKPGDPPKAPELHPKDKTPESGKVDLSGGINTQKDEPTKRK